MGKFQEIIASETPTLVDFYADWCGPCHMMSPILQQLAEAYKGKLQVIKVDVDKNQQASTVFQVRSIPTMILFRKGEIIWRGAGAMPYKNLASIIDQHLIQKQEN
ncbi:MAG: thioredoxin [Cytophagales bacterium]|nr:MAG: thioredoxin [Cytophagales bacterium]